MLSSSNSIEILKSFSKQLGKLEKTKSDNHYQDSDIDEDQIPTNLGITKSISSKPLSKKDQNFKVIVRVRPPLPRELDSSTRFAPITHISKNNK